MQAAELKVEVEGAHLENNFGITCVQNWLSGMPSSLQLRPLEKAMEAKVAFDAPGALAQGDQCGEPDARANTRKGEVG